MSRWSRPRYYPCAHAECERQSLLLWRPFTAEEQGLRAHNCCNRHTHVLHLVMGVRVPPTSEYITIKVLHEQGRDHANQGTRRTAQLDESRGERETQ